ncbi:unnamed protein product [Adineta steineri]|uniref:Uncharacterized protein n=1 Tax=Adineta steineri TaxID=433720 RepID=A0A813MVD7_9BILA|nr:unnamed protein product [Adineta steineri]CAF4000105.1 unnamed protein product [Adineta steineri]
MNSIRHKKNAQESFFPTQTILFFSFLTGLIVCDECVPAKTVKLDSITTTTVTDTSSSQINIGIVVAAGLGGALLTLVVGLVIFFIWKKRVKQKLIAYAASNTSTISTIQRPPPPLPPPPLPSLSRLPSPIIVPALYDLPLSRRGSTTTVTPSISYHFYEETP